MGGGAQGQRELNTLHARQLISPAILHVNILNMRKKSVGLLRLQTPVDGCILVILLYPPLTSTCMQCLSI